MDDPELVAHAFEVLAKLAAFLIGLPKCGIVHLAMFGNEPLSLLGEPALGLGGGFVVLIPFGLQAGAGRRKLIGELCMRRLVPCGGVGEAAITLIEVRLEPLELSLDPFDFK